MINEDDTIYHIYAKNKCLYNCLEKEEFEEKWQMLNIMVGLMQTDYSHNDLSYVKLELPGIVCVTFCQVSALEIVY